jgi:hypothetical protein
VITRSVQGTNTGRRSDGMKPAKMITAPTSRYEKNQGELDGRSKIIIIGDSHTRGYASDLSQKLNNLNQITVYVKLNADVVQLMDTAKEEVSKLTKNYINFLG